MMELLWGFIGAFEGGLFICVLSFLSHLGSTFSPVVINLHENIKKTGRQFRNPHLPLHF